MEMDLLVVDDENEDAWAVGIVTAPGTWIGGTDQITEGAWVWLDGPTAFYAAGESVDGAYVGWGSDEPNSFFGDEDCISLTAENGWWDVDCAGGRYYFCERVDAD